MNLRLHQNALMLFLLFLSCSGQKQVIATVGISGVITAEMLRTRMAFQRGNFDPTLLRHEAHFDAFRRAVLESLIEEMMLIDEAGSRGISLSEVEMKRELEKNGVLIDDLERSMRERGIQVAAWKTRQSNRALIRKLIDEAVVKQIAVTDEDVARYYQKHRATFSIPARYRARQIVIETEAEAGRIHENIAREHNFRELGWIDSSHTTTEFISELERLEPGEISAPLKTEHGQLILQLLEKQPSAQRPLEEVRSKIIADLRAAQKEHAFRQWFSSLAARTPVEIHESILKEVSFHE